MITKEEFNECLNGYHITDCVVRNSNYFHFIARNTLESQNSSPISEGKVSKREIGYYRDEPVGERLGFQGFANFEKTFVGATVHPFDQVVCVDAGGMVYSRGSDHEEFETEIPASINGPRRGSIQRIRMIKGKLYIVGSGHTICRRSGLSEWESLCANLPAETKADFDDVDRSADMAFEDVDGFSENDIYAIAGRGRIWHFNGQKWEEVSFPSNMRLYSICCAADGNVYMGAQSGSVFMGRNQQWKLIHRGDLSLPFKDIVWHAGKAWATNDYGLWCIEKEKVKSVELPSEITICAGNLSTADGVMLMAGTYGAAFHNGEKWEIIFNSNDYENN